MKKIITILLAVMMACFSLTAFAAETVIADFEVSDIDAFMGFNTGLTSIYGVEAPVHTAVAGDSGNGVRVTTTQNAGFVQSYYMTDADMLAAAKAAYGADKYLKIYVENNSSQSLGFRFTFNDTTDGVVSFDCSNAILVGTDGSKPAINTADGGGMAANSALIIPVGFKGYAYFPFANLTIEAPANWNRPAFTGFENIKNIEFDIRCSLDDHAAFAGTDYVIDSLSIADEVTETADVSVIAYAVMAITGLGALVVAKKR
jgi:hypothetical protein